MIQPCHHYLVLVLVPFLVLILVLVLIVVLFLVVIGNTENYPAELFLD